MTIFGQRRLSKMSALHQKLDASPKEDSKSPDDSLFADINWPDDMDEMADCVPGYDTCSRTPSSGYSSKSRDSFSPPVMEVCELENTMNNSASCYFSSDITGIAPLDDSCTGEAQPSTSGKKCQFTKEVRSVLRTWYHEHQDNPYPTSKEKDELVEKTKLTRNQLSLWLANTRRKQRAKKQQRQQQQEEADNIALPQKPMVEMTPMDRWKVLPIELEAVAAPLIVAACAESPPPAEFSESPEDDVRYQGSLFDVESTNASRYTAPNQFSDSRFGTSLASRETAMTSLVGSSAMSDHTSFSYHSLNPSVSYSLTSRDRRRRRCNVTKAPKPASKYKSRPFQCTFCPDNSFITKHDWQRHEKAQHLSLESWTCCLDGGVMDSDEGLICAFCDHLNPDTTHLETHSFSACQMKDLSERTFYRKDHFQQHLRLTHEAKLLPRMGLWKTTLEDISSRCGFCSATFTKWSQRVDHLAAHFKSKVTMQDWVGGLGFEPHIAALVERSTSHVSPVPLTATSGGNSCRFIPADKRHISSGEICHSQAPISLNTSQSLLELDQLSMLPPPVPKPLDLHTGMDMNYSFGLGTGLTTYQQSLGECFPIDPILEFSRGLEDSPPISLDTGGLDIETMDWANFGL
jgi:hypothetical protein